MLRVLISAPNKKVKKISILGHADYDSYGKDIVCSSVSSITITTINAILMFDENYISYRQEKDNFEIIINKNDKIVDNLIKNMLNLLRELAIDYPKNVKIEEEDK